MVGDCKCDHFYQCVKVCTERDEDCAVSLQISSKDCCEVVMAAVDRRFCLLWFH